MPIVIVPQDTPLRSGLGEPLPYGYEITYWQASIDVYGYLSEAFDIHLNTQLAYLITDQPLKVQPIGLISGHSDWVDHLG